MTNLELERYAKLLGIPNFRGVFMTDNLRNMKPRKYENVILNLDKSSGAGTHWVCFRKALRNVVYFDSFGLRPPPEVLFYLKGNQIEYSNEKLQKYNASNCGKLCLLFLIKTSKQEKK